MKTDIQQLEELEALAKAVNAAPAETLAKCNALIEDLVQDRIAKGDTDLQARRHVLSDQHEVGSKLYKMHCDLTEQMAFQQTVFLG
ncbi:MAG: hypothetical protein FP825_06545 [Hyphomonas sp.]|uniref:hypothetical protein n=1 Tax=Hyphomonas sp. TaxID=87 RepID=UPI0017E10517|nr:hypothetical protein [Hyphomonas sp.]MBA3068119.1 hypothetical protein [Hyphomonas sp.]MBU3922431.1 hypothetical protein [Alphaproteobacteria bacterium]MBU4061454.1 hypothetical protein [Alphaproteobacteria bacterium]MBU4165022.1 hypothetical protein [Alphaproteobacteria bacterium]